MVLLALISVQTSVAKDPILLTRSYINWYANDAVDQMIKYGIPASVTLAQAIFESHSGNSFLAKQSNNHFGIKCHTTWEGDTVVKTDDTLNECFRKYATVEESYADHSLFLRSRPRYAHLFNLQITDYKSWCFGLKTAGYATYPSYAEELIKIIEENKLYLLDVYEKIDLPLRQNKEKKLVASKLRLELFSVNDLATAGILFINEKKVDLHLLPLLLRNSNISGAIAEK